MSKMSTVLTILISLAFTVVCMAMAKNGTMNLAAWAFLVPLFLASIDYD